jgi:hypothetical protein
VINNVTVNKVSYNGGTGGVAAAPTPQERAAAREPHAPPTPLQHQHVQEAARNPALAAKANGGHPAIAATPRPGAFNAPGVVGAHGTSPNAIAHAQAAAAPVHAPPVGTQARTQVGGTQAHTQVATTAKPPAGKPQPAKPTPPKNNEKHEAEKPR